MNDTARQLAEKITAMLRYVAWTYLEVERAQRPVTALRRACTDALYLRIREEARRPGGIVTADSIGSSRWDMSGDSVEAVVLLIDRDGAVSALTIQLRRGERGWNATGIRRVE